MSKQYRRPIGPPITVCLALLRARRRIHAEREAATPTTNGTPATPTKLGT